MFYKYTGKGLFYSLMLLMLSFNSWATKVNLQSEGYGIKVLPNTCISLHKGRRCFVKTNITWYAQATGNYCISINANVVHKKCWQNASKGEFIYEVASKKNVAITLYSAHDNLVLGEANIEVGWLYTGDSRKRRWRLF